MTTAGNGDHSGSFFIALSETIISTRKTDGLTRSECFEHITVVYSVYGRNASLKAERM